MEQEKAEAGEKWKGRQVVRGRRGDGDCRESKTEKY